MSEEEKYMAEEEKLNNENIENIEIIEITDLPVKDDAANTYEKKYGILAIFDLI